MAQQLLVNGEPYGSHRNKVNANETELYAAVASAQAVANAAIPASQKAAANGVASLDGSGKVPSGQLPAAAAFTLAAATDVASFDLGTTNTSVAAVKATANAAATAAALATTNANVTTLTNKQAFALTQPASLNASTGVATIPSGLGGGTFSPATGTAPPSGISAVVNVTSGTTTLPTAVDGVTSMKQNDELVWFTALSKWVLSKAILASTDLSDGAAINSSISTNTSNIATNTSNISTLTANATIQTINAQTGTTYTLVLTDAGQNVDMSNASANTLTIPLNSSVAFPVGTIISVTQAGAGTTTIAGAGGVTLVKPSADSLSISAQYRTAQLYKTATDTWRVLAN